MKIKNYFFLLVLFLCLICGFCSFVVLGSAGMEGAEPILFRMSFGKGLYILILQLLFILLIIFLFFFYYKIIVPFRIIGNGIDLLRGQDFSSRLRTVGQADADEMVSVFNSMMSTLKEERLSVREKNQFLDLLIKVSPMGLIMLDFDGRITDCNQSAITLLNDEDGRISNLEGLKISDIKTTLGAAIAGLSLGETDTFRIDNNKICRCSYLYFLDHGFKHPFVIIESLASEIMEAERKAYSKVIKMVAHEVNNTVAGITSTLDSINDALSGDSANDKLCSLISVCAERSMDMSRFVTNFADVVKLPSPQLKMTDLNLEVAESKMFMENLCARSNTVLHLLLSEKPVMVMLDAPMFELALVNMVKNAVESSSGDIWLSTDSVSNSLTVTDNGHGIQEGNESKLFTPFFSTKPNGKGLGLIMIHEILTRHNCKFSLKTGADGLTRFTVNF